MATSTLREPVDAEAVESVALPGAVVAATAGEVRALLHRVVDLGTGTLVLDLGAVERLDVVGLGVLMGAHRRAVARGRELRVARASRRISAILHVTGLDRALCPRERGRRR